MLISLLRFGKGFSEEFMHKHPVFVAFWMFLTGSFALLLGIYYVFRLKRVKTKKISKGIKAWFYVILGLFLVLLATYNLLRK